MPSGDTTRLINMHATSAPTDKTVGANGMSFPRVSACVLHFHLVVLKVTFHIYFWPVDLTVHVERSSITASVGATVSAEDA